MIELNELPPGVAENGCKEPFPGSLRNSMSITVSPMAIMR
jgi:hypothetical protein